jgi:hypothetical protein
MRFLFLRAKVVEKRLLVADVCQLWLLKKETFNK